MNPAKPPITQKEVDAVASFVEACRELAGEPYFSKDNKLLLQMGAENGPHTFVLGDRFHFRSALISFRRLWMPSELSCWRSILRILDKSHHSLSLHQADGQRIENILLEKHDLGKVLQLNASAEKIINLWLNTVFAHDGLMGPNKRSEFEQIVDEFGHGFFEYTFRRLVSQLGHSFMNISRMSAEPALEFYEETYQLKPSFRIGAAFGQKRRERTKEGHLIIRQASTEFYSEEPMEFRMTRLLERNENKLAQNILLKLENPKNEILRAVLKSTDLTNLLESLDGRLVVMEPLEGKDVSENQLQMIFSIGQSRVYVSRDNQITCTPSAQKILDAALKDFKNQLLQT